MKIGDLVKYGKWFTGPERHGIIVEEGFSFCLVYWAGCSDFLEWEDFCELELVKKKKA